MDDEPEMFVHCIPETGRLLPSASRWNSIEVNLGHLPASSIPYDSIPSKCSKSYEFTLTITDRTHFRRFKFASGSVVLLVIAAFLLIAFLPRKTGHGTSSKDIPLALTHALAFFDAQRSGLLPKGYSVGFRGDSGLHDGVSGRTHGDLVGGFYDSGNNIKFSFPTAYTVSLLCWTVIEYRERYEAIGELDHVKDIIRWGTDYLLKLYVPSNSTARPTILYSQVGSTAKDAEDDITCWQRPEDMKYERPVSTCRNSATDLAGEMMAALAAASLVFSQEETYSRKLIHQAEGLFEFANMNQTHETYTANECGAEARNFYNSSGYLDELAWGGTWLFFATGNFSYLEYATAKFESASQAQLSADKGVFYWNNKLPATAVLLTRLRYLHDPGYPYEKTLKASTDMTTNLICSYVSLKTGFGRTPGGLVMLIRPYNGGQLQYAVTAAFLTKLYNDYLNSLQIPGESCGSDFFPLGRLQSFSRSQVNYVLGDNPEKMSYLVGFGDTFPERVHHRGGSIPWDGRHYTCEEGKRWRDSEDPNPNILTGALVAGPDKDDEFFDERDLPLYTEATLSGNAGLVAALIAILEHPVPSFGSDDINGGIDLQGIFANLKLGTNT
uniref:Endoglucanase n=1 Tax=Anthurium amnicola TaxID=1678845 RepID=A0A1D1XCA6_9ARAE